MNLKWHKLNGVLYFCLFLWFHMTCEISLYSDKMRLIHSTAKGQCPWSEPIEGWSAAAYSVALHSWSYGWFSLVYLLCPRPVEASIKLSPKMTMWQDSLQTFFCPCNTQISTPILFCHIFSTVEASWISVMQRTLYLLMHSPVMR